MISMPDIWLHPPARLLLKSDDVHVWRANLDQEPATIQALSGLLAPDERQRADRYYFQKDRDHFVVARGVLRLIFSRYLDISPDRIRFSYNQYGKPALDSCTGDAGLRFNLSHSHGLALYAFTRGREIGLDIEFIREDFASLKIAESFFSPKEVEMLMALPSELQSSAFYNCWTRKEAYIKALGEGLSHPLHRFTVSLIAGEPVALLSTDDDPQESSRWSLMELTPGPGYVAALAVTGRTPMIHYLQWLG
jgi:4'-phosphopantetheinyl transferase